MEANPKSVFPVFALVLVFSLSFWILDAIYPIELLPGLLLSAVSVLAAIVNGSYYYPRVFGSIALILAIALFVVERFLSKTPTFAITSK